jgi:leader peptidase (prepilin peptidase)/N-methyltransferase
MTLLEHLTGIAALAPTAALIVRFPKPLFAEAGSPPSLGLETRLAGGLFLAGVLLFETGLGGGPLGRWALGAVGVVMLAIVYADLRFLIIPDLYSALIALAALVGPLALPWVEALIGALVCGGMLWTVGYGFRRLRGVEGLGLGDVKLAAALGALLGPIDGVRVIALAALCAILAVVALQAWRRRRLSPEAELEPVLAAFGAALALAGGAMLLWSLHERV